MKHLDNDTPPAVALQLIYDQYNPARIKTSTSFGAEGVVLIDLLSKITDHPNIFTVDTGRNFQETYDVWQKIQDRYDINIQSYSASPIELNLLYTKIGPNGFYNSVEGRSSCCKVRKTRPLATALIDADVWITALRAGQSKHRAGIAMTEYSYRYSVLKVCPLLTWSEADIWTYIRQQGLDYNRLYDMGYLSIGCMPCTRPQRPAESLRAGRWWWESKTSEKECGIHLNSNQNEGDSK